MRVECGTRVVVEAAGWGGGEGGIRTHGGPKDHNGFRDRPIRPLWHLSGADYSIGEARLARFWPLGDRLARVCERDLYFGSYMEVRL